MILGARRLAASHTVTNLKSAKKFGFSFCFFFPVSASGTIIQKDTSVNNQAILMISCLLFLFHFEVATFLPKNVRNITGNRVKNGGGWRVKDRQEKQNTGYAEQRTRPALSSTILHPRSS